MHRSIDGPKPRCVLSLVRRGAGGGRFPAPRHGGGDLGGGKTIRDFSDREAQLSSNHSLDRYPERIQIDLRYGGMAADVKVFDGSFPRLNQRAQGGLGVHRCCAVNNQLFAVGVMLPGKHPGWVNQPHRRAGRRQTQPVTPTEISFRKGWRLHGEACPVRSRRDS